MKKLLFLLLIAGTCLAGLPPTTTKDSTDSNPVTTFNFEFPNFTGTHTGTAFSLGVNGIAGGGTNEGSQTSNGVCYYDGTGLTTGSSLTWDGNALTSSQVIDSGLTASTPIYANGLMQLTSGTFSGNTTEFATVSGAVTSGHLATWDASGNIADGGAPATGTVTAVSVTSANGLAGSSSGGATPALTLSTTVTGLVKGNGTALSAAVADTDYQSPITLTTTGTSGAATFIGNILNVPVYAGTTYTASDSLSLTGSNFTLLNDSASPGNSFYYGTNASGTKGWSALPTAPRAPTFQVFTSGSGTYTLPTTPAPLYIHVRAIGGGGGGAGSGSGPGSGTNGSAGGETCFSSGSSCTGVVYVAANGGSGGLNIGNGGAGTGGTASITTSATVIQVAAITGANGFTAFNANANPGTFTQGGAGGPGPYGGGGIGAGPSNSGAGGAGAGLGATSTSCFLGNGGGAGGYAEAVLTSPSSTYSYNIGALGTHGAAATSGSSGSDGASGILIIEEFYQ